MFHREERKRVAPSPPPPLVAGQKNLKQEEPRLRRYVADRSARDEDVASQLFAEVEASRVVQTTGASAERSTDVVFSVAFARRPPGK